MSLWQFRNIPTSVSEAPFLARFSPILRNLIASRNITDETILDSYLSPDYEKGIHNPFLLKDMDRGVSRLRTAMEKGERIAVWSDYDADGIPGATLLNDFFKVLGYTNVSFYIPDRHTEGFGLNKEGLHTLKKEGITLLITVDCGIADGEEVALAKELGIDVIITDHHVPPLKLPDAVAIINPNQLDCQYPNKGLCGAGVAWKFVCAFLSDPNSKLPATNYKLPIAGYEKWLLDMVGLATLSDMVPLTGENRVLASFGLLVLRKSRRVGFRTLMAKARVFQPKLSEDDISFSITPRINAASRMGVARDAFSLLTTDDEGEALRLTEILHKANEERKGKVASIVREARVIVASRRSMGRGVVVLGNPDWRPSLLGLVANTLANEESRPVFMWGREGGSTFKGSCRTGNHVSIISLMERAKHLFTEFGGHHASGGFTVDPEKIHVFEEELDRVYNEIILKDSIPKKIMVDGDLSLPEVTEDLMRDIERLGPFGMGNERPIFIFRDARIIAVKQFGKGKEHLELVLDAEGHAISAIQFFASKEIEQRSLGVGMNVTLCASMERSMYRAVFPIRLRIISFV